MSAALAIALTWSCRAEPREPSSGRNPRGTDPPDSLVIVAGDRVEVWFTLARKDRGTDGTVCVERGLEIRRGSTRVRVPLLYTGTPPVLLNESTMRAELWNHCRPVDTYRVDLQSGRPVRERPGGTP